MRSASFSPGTSSRCHFLCLGILFCFCHIWYTGILSSDSALCGNDTSLAFEDIRTVGDQGGRFFFSLEFLFGWIWLQET